MTEFVTVLHCVECGAESEDARGWQAHLTDDDELGIYCDECARSEFGDA